MGGIEARCISHIRTGRSGGSGSIEDNQPFVETHDALTRGFHNPTELLFALAQGLSGQLARCDIGDDAPGSRVRFQRPPPV